MPQYRYEALPSPYSIRLLKAEKVAHSSTVNYSLHVFPLESSPEYLALSYTWGNAVSGAEPQASRTQEDVLDLGLDSLPISSNLYDFMHTWTPGSEFDYIWIDAVCINQSDTAEKVAQVQLMGDIYSSARRVLVWLGLSESHVKNMEWIYGEFYDALVRYTNRYGYNSLHKYMVISPDLIQAIDIEIQMGNYWNHWMAFINFYQSRRWFLRAWVVQEVILAKDVTVFYGSGAQLSWDAMVNLPRLLSFNGPAELELSEAATRTKVYRNVSQIYSSITTQPTSESPLFETFRSIAGDDDPESIWYASMYSLLKQTRYLNTSDSRDSLFALLGMANKSLPTGMAPPILPNYTKSENCIFRALAEKMLQKLPRLVFLSDAIQAPRHQVDLPSWVPDLDYFNPRRSFLRTFATSGLFTDPPFSAWPVQNSHDCQLSFRDNAMIINGGELDTVIAKTPLPRSANLSVLVPFLEFCLALDTIYSPTHQVRSEAVWRCLIINTGDEAYPAPASDSKGLSRIFADWTFDSIVSKKVSSWVDKLSLLDKFTALGDEAVFPTHLEVMQNVYEMSQELNSAKDDPDSWLETMGLIYNRLASPPSHWIEMYDSLSEARAILKTSRGYIGLGPDWTEEGDRVCLLESAAVPYVLKTIPSSGHYKVVGEAYMHGFMHGEALTPEFMERVSLMEIV